MTGTRTALRHTQAANFTTNIREKPIVASGKVIQLEDYRYPAEPPVDWLMKRDFAHAQPIKVTPEGHVYGHVCEWGKWHVAYSGRRVMPPRARDGYANFVNKGTLCDNGQVIQTGPIVFDCDHADEELGLAAAKDVMAHTGRAVADVAVYEDQFGVQIAGAVRPDASPAAVRTLRGSDISPDWRPVPGERAHAMIALVCVNMSGFITKAIVASGGKAPKSPEGVVRVGWDYASDSPTTMIGVGMLRRAEAEKPWEALERRVDELEAFNMGLRQSAVMSKFNQTAYAKALNERIDAAASRARID